MKELNSFTVERLEEITELKALSFPPSHHELAALARIALAAKRAEPVMFRFKYPGERNYTYITHRKPDAFEMEKCEIELLYTTPQLNSPEGWKLVPNMPTLGMLSVLGLTGSFESMQQRYADMLYAAPEKDNG
ncbi:Uncharacterised protein [Yersinia enterocolitica]|nr:Uncharacterised protein [Yersinia enterocolitica]